MQNHSKRNFWKFETLYEQLQCIVGCTCPRRFIRTALIPNMADTEVAIEVEESEAATDTTKVKEQETKEEAEPKGIFFVVVF